MTRPNSSSAPCSPLGPSSPSEPSSPSGPCSPSGPLYIGLDGGGTKTNALLGCKLDGQLRTIGAGQGGPSNPRAVGFDRAFQNIDQAIANAFRSAKLDRVCAEQITLCLAGAGRQEERSTVEDWIVQSQIASRACVISEAEAVLEASRQADWQDTDRPNTSGDTKAEAEIALICGTGSLAWGRRIDDPNRIARSGGWGYLLGDEGSGFWIGQRTVQAACHAADGRRTETDLLEAVLQYLNLESPSQIIGWCYDDSNSRQRIAAVASLTFQIADQSGGSSSCSQLANEIITQAASDLAVTIRAVIQKLGASRYRLAVAGSVVVHQPSFLELIVDRLTQLGSSPLQVAVINQPALGCLGLAIT